MGLTQAISYSLTTVEKAKQFQIKPLAEPMKLDFPMSSDHVATRMNIVGGLLNDIAYNVARNVDNVALYEEGRVFLPMGDERPVEQEHLAAAVTGQMVANSWNKKDQPVDFFQLKGIVERYLKNMGIAGKVAYVPTSDRPEMHPGRTADITVDDQLVGFIGQVHPTTAKAYDIPATYVASLDLTALLEKQPAQVIFTDIPKFQASKRDIALLVDRVTTNQEILDVITSSKVKTLIKAELFDVYTGENVAADKKSLAYTLTFQSAENQLTDDEITAAVTKITKKLVEFGAEIR